MRRLALLLALLLTTPAWAEITLTGPDGPVETREPVDITVEGIVFEDFAKARVVFWPRKTVRVRPMLLWGGGGKLVPSIEFYSKTPGEYLLWVALPSADGLDCAELVIQVGESPEPGPDPNPRPDPDPDPDPQPGPTVKELWGVVVCESNDRDEYGPKIAQVLYGARLRDIKDFHWIVVDKDVKDENGNTPADVKTWIDRYKQRGWVDPRLYFLDERGILREEGDLPKTVDGVITKVRRWLGE